SEPGGNSITLENLALTLFDSSGTLLAAYTIAAPITFDITLTGVGNAGFGFQLDAAQAALANQYLNYSGLRIGAALTASDASGGHETLFVRSINGGGITPNETGVPEPSTYAVVGLALVGLQALRRKQKPT
ncbi:MAG: PEP-CTERM sorting domain-containing protein, partial [Chloroflexia bacterium]